MSSTLYLDPEEWDLTVDSNGDIALAKEPYAIAQDVASECRLWLGEARYDTTDGVSYERSILGQRPTPADLTNWYQDQAKKVSGVNDATVILQFDNRQLTGQIQLTIDGQEYELQI